MGGTTGMAAPAGAAVVRAMAAPETAEAVEGARGAAADGMLVLPPPPPQDGPPNRAGLVCLRQGAAGLVCAPGHDGCSLL
eukprot:NODE_8794_length_367_cov_205.205128.p4 GENE.NODE_8794_length_367_cov_205.205128~~NODE_8794_length_367_cov_205.205128.p4  ORF type:complete len:80 (+),score=10.83 NODE_8794_length_367_cov_205.205128:3-242(+)